MSKSTLIKKSKKRIGNVHPVVWKYAKDLIKEAYKQGLYIMFSDGHRTHAEQNALYAQGRTKSGSIVTNARGGQSLHNYGIALDMFITNKKGTTASWNAGKLKEVAKIAKQLGFEWGGDWTSFKDYPHIQMTGGLSLSQLQAGKKPNLKYKGKTIKYKPKKQKKKWNNVGKKWTGQTLVKNDKGGAVKQLQKLVGVKADGYFGADTLGAVRKAQKDAGIAVDGMAGKATYNALKGGKSSGMSIDGKWGIDVTKGLQRVFGTPVDGKLSGQSKNTVTNALYSNTAVFGSGGSVVIKALQKKLGVTADGLLGPSTIRALQKRLGTPVDGKLSKVSPMVKELQKRLNKGKI